MYFAKIESSAKAAQEYNQAMRAAASRRLGEKPNAAAKAIALDWNRQQHVANGANKTRADGTAARTINRKQAARLQARLKQSATWPYMNRAEHLQHKPGSFN